jgi:hypothetical protein
MVHSCIVFCFIAFLLTFSVDNCVSKGNQAGYFENRGQQALLSTIENALRVIGTAQDNLLQRPEMADIGNDTQSLQWKVNFLDVNKQNVSSHLAAMNAATAQVLIHTADGPYNSDYNAIGAAVSSMYESYFKVDEYYKIEVNFRFVCQKIKIKKSW